MKYFNQSLIVSSDELLYKIPFVKKKVPSGQAGLIILNIVLK